MILIYTPVDFSRDATSTVAEHTAGTISLNIMEISLHLDVQVEYRVCLSQLRRRSKYNDYYENNAFFLLAISGNNTRDFQKRLVGNACVYYSIFDKTSNFSKKYAIL